MKSIASFYIILCVLHMSNGCQRKTVGNGQEMMNYLDEVLESSNLIKSPKEDYAFLVTDENKKDLSTVIIFNLKDSSLVVKKNLYVDSASWINDHVVRIFTKPEMVRTDKTENQFFDYHVEREKYQKK